MPDVSADPQTTRLFTADEVRRIAYEVCEPPFDLSDDGRLEWMNTVLQEHGILPDPGSIRKVA
jgi:hypothetical protein